MVLGKLKDTKWLPKFKVMLGAIYSGINETKHFRNSIRLERYSITKWMILIKCLMKTSTLRNFLM